MCGVWHPGHLLWYIPHHVCPQGGRYMSYSMVTRGWYHMYIDIWCLLSVGLYHVCIAWSPAAPLKIMYTKNVHSTGVSICILWVYLVVTDHQAWDGNTKRRYVISPIKSNAKVMLAWKPPTMIHKFSWWACDDVWSVGAIPALHREMLVSSSPVVV